MSWKEIIKAPTSNKDAAPRWRGYKGNRPYSYIDDDMMEQIVEDLGLPETDEDGEKIEYEEEPDFSLVPSFKVLGNDQYELEIKFEGEIKIWGEDARNAAHTFTADDIEYETIILELNTEKPFELDYEFSQYYNGKILLEVFIEK
tara:strand:+ start:35 stop:469 length:435 start_codon:yes stop_codon:yes gene_type:complete